MELQFIQNELGNYEASFMVNADFNVHVEREEQGFLSVDISTVADTRKAPAFSEYYRPNVLDRDFDGIVYPKYVTITSRIPVTLGVVTENQR